jgi:hypothetical protein
VPSSPTRTARFGLTAIKVIDQQNLYLLSPYLPVPLTGLALAHQPGQVKRISGSDTGRLGHCKPTLAVAYSSRPGSASLLVATVSTGG